MNSYTIKGPWKFQLTMSTESPLTKIVMNQIELTTYKFRMPVPISELTGEYKVRGMQVYAELKKQCKEVPVIEPCTKFNNACYFHGLDEVVNNLPERERDYQLKLFCNDFGADFESVKNNLGPHMVFMGERFMSPEVLAHEFGHYLNTIGKGEPDGDKVHAKYGKATSRARFLKMVGNTSALVSMMTSKDRTSTPIVLGGAALSFAAVPLMSRPIILSEMKASQTGMKNLIKAGAAKEDLIEYDKFMKGAFGTYKTAYVTLPLIHAAIYGTGALITHKILKK
jgi:hypothetical protein